MSPIATCFEQIEYQCDVLMWYWPTLFRLVSIFFGSVLLVSNIVPKCIGYLIPNKTGITGTSYRIFEECDTDYRTICIRLEPVPVFPQFCTIAPLITIQLKILS